MPVLLEFRVALLFIRPQPGDVSMRTAREISAAARVVAATGHVELCAALREEDRAIAEQSVWWQWLGAEVSSALATRVTGMLISFG